MSSAPSTHLKCFSRTSRYVCCSCRATSMLPRCCSSSPAFHRPARHSSTCTSWALSHGVAFMPRLNAATRAPVSTPGDSCDAWADTSTNASSSQSLVKTSVSSMSKNTAFSRGFAPPPSTPLMLLVPRALSLTTRVLRSPQDPAFAANAAAAAWPSLLLRRGTLAAAATVTTEALPNRGLRATVVVAKGSEANKGDRRT